MLLKMKQQFLNELKSKRKEKKELNLSDKPHVYNFKYETTSNALTLKLLNNLFAIVEQFDIMVDGLIMNAFKYAEVRNFGKTVYDDLTAKEIKERKKDKTSAVAILFSATIYRYNSLNENQITLYNNETHSFFNFTIVTKEAPLHSCKILPLEKRGLQSKIDEMYMFSPHISTVQIMTEENYFCEASNPYDALVAGSIEKPEVYDIAMTLRVNNDKSKAQTYKDAFLSILRSKALNDMQVYDKLMLKLKEQDNLTEEEYENTKITKEEFIKTLQKPIKQS